MPAPVEIRFGIGIRHIDAEIDLLSSTGADGPAYRCARSAVNSIHLHNDYKKSKIMIEAQDNIEFMEIVSVCTTLQNYRTDK